MISRYLKFFIASSVVKNFCDEVFNKNRKLNKNSSFGERFCSPSTQIYDQFLIATRFHYSFSVGLLGVSLVTPVLIMILSFFRVSNYSFTKIKLIAFHWSRHACKIETKQKTSPEHSSNICNCISRRNNQNKRKSLIMYSELATQYSFAKNLSNVDQMCRHLDSKT